MKKRLNRKRKRRALTDIKKNLKCIIKTVYVLCCCCLGVVVVVVVVVLCVCVVAGFFCFVFVCV